MGTGWRRAFCTTISRDPERHQQQQQQQQQKKKSHSTSSSPRSCTRLSFFSTASNPSTPRLRCRTSSDSADSTPRPTKTPSSLFFGSNPSSPRSPLKLSLFKQSFKFRSSCGVCMSSVKTGAGTAIYTAECSHAFHFPCIASHVRANGALVCPVCRAAWKDVPLLAIHKMAHSASSAGFPPPEEKKIVVDCNSTSSSPLPSPRATGDGHVPARCYDDDEPLLSPTATNAKISPIPEADEDREEEEEEDVQEFQGFFVNPTPSCSSKYSGRSRAVDAGDRYSSNNVQVMLLPEAAVVSVSSSHQTYAVALRVKAPPHSAATRSRAPVDLVAVLDASGSMTGAKLLMMKRAMRLVISSLGSADRLSIVAFSAAPKRLLQLRRMTAQGQRAARRIVDRIVCGPGSSVGEALRKASKVLEDRRERNPVATIILLSDGQDDGRGGVHHSNSHSNKRQPASHVSSTRFAHIEIPVHSFGLGKSKGGGYRSSHGHQEPGEDAFAKCVGGLLSVVVQDLRIQLGFPSGDAEIAAVYSSTIGRPSALGSGSIRIGDLYAEEERELLVELRVPISAAGSHRAMSVRCLYKDPASKEVVYGREQALIVPPPTAVRSTAQKIERLRNTFIATRAVAESRRLIECGGDLASAHQLLTSARGLVLQSTLDSAAECARGIEAEVAELYWRRQSGNTMGVQRRRDGGVTAIVDENGDPLTPTSAWRAAEKLAKVAMIKKSMNRVSDLHGFENARF